MFFFSLHQRKRTLVNEPSILFDRLGDGIYNFVLFILRDIQSYDTAGKAYTQSIAMQSTRKIGRFQSLRICICHFSPGVTVRADCSILFNPYNNTIL